jgi:hypothetical protein
MLSVVIRSDVMLSKVLLVVVYADCQTLVHYTECRYAECYCIYGFHHMLVCCYAGCP